MLLENYIFLVGFIICLSSSGPRHSLVLVGETLSCCCCHSPSFNVNQWGSRLAGAIRPIIGVSDKCSFIIATTVKHQSIILLDRVGWLELGLEQAGAVEDVVEAGPAPGLWFSHAQHSSLLWSPISRDISECDSFVAEKSCCPQDQTDYISLPEMKLWRKRNTTGGKTLPLLNKAWNSIFINLMMDPRFMLNQLNLRH